MTTAFRTKCARRALGAAAILLSAGMAAPDAGGVTIAGPAPAPERWDAPSAVMPCSGCHGIDGNSHLDYIPRLAGLDAGYIEGQMKAFRLSPIPPTIELPGFMAERVRGHEPKDGWGEPIGWVSRVFRIGFPQGTPAPGGRTDGPARINMIGMAHATGEDETKDIAKWYAEQKPAPGAPGRDPTLVDQGKELFDKGVPERNVLACRDCHGATGEGMGAFPRIGGQHAAYLRNQLHAFADGARTHAAPMNAYARQLTDDEIRALAAYLQTL